jgi:branched-chain amino acid transport system ATP-binding protein
VLLKVQALDTFYGESHVLQGVTLDVDQGEIVALVGRNGVGKTTTLRSIMLLTPPRRGRINLKNQDLMGQPRYVPARLGMGYVPEDRRIFPNLTVRENLLIGMKEGPMDRDPWTVERIYLFFPLLAERDKQKGRNLSGGEQQLLSIARAFMGNPDLLLVDEPTEGLAPMIVQKIWEVLLETNRNGMSILVAEQNLRAVQAVARRTYVLSKGVVVFSGPTEELTSRTDIIDRYLKI